MTKKFKFVLMGVSLLALIAVVSVIVIPDVFINAKNRLIVATTTSTVDAGLLDYLKPYFDNKFNANLTWLSLGTGQALAVAARGDADILLVHDRVREDAFVTSGNGTLRVTVMYNDFVLVGPPDDPANASGSDLVTSMQKIASAGAVDKAIFVSRGDGSGTEALEKRLWDISSVYNYNGSRWYRSVGSGMSATLRVANELGAYTISDRATFYKLKSSMNESFNLVVICENDSKLLNPYGIILLNNSRYPNINSDLALKFLLFITSPEGQALVGNYSIVGKQVFFPVYGRPETIGLPSENEAIKYIESMKKTT